MYPASIFALLKGICPENTPDPLGFTRLNMRRHDRITPQTIAEGGFDLKELESVRFLYLLIKENKWPESGLLALERWGRSLFPDF
jgi:hypothetical protein